MRQFKPQYVNGIKGPVEKFVGKNLQVSPNPVHFGMREGEGRFGKAVSLDGIDDCIDLVTMDHPWAGLTTSIWINPTADGGIHRRILSKSTDTNANNQFL